MAYIRKRTTQTQYSSDFNGEKIYGNTRFDIAEIYRKRGEAAEIAGDAVLAQIYFNHEEHWKRDE